MTTLVKNSIIYTIGIILPQAVGFLLLPIITRYLTPEDYGVVSSMGVLGGVLIIFLTLAVDRSIYRLYYDYGSAEKKEIYLGTISISLFITSTIGVFILFVFHDYVAFIFKSIPFFPYYVYIILATYFSIFLIVPQIYYMITEQATKFFLLSVGLSFLNIALILWFIVGLERGAEGYLGARVVANLLFVPLSLFILKKIVNFKFDLQMLKNGLSFSLPIIPTLLSAWILDLSDRIFIERYFTLQDVGIYSLGYQIALVVTVIAGGIHTAYFPFFFKLANSDNQENSKKTLYHTNTIYILIVLLTVFLISFFSKEIVTIMIAHEYLEAYKIIPLIAIGYLFCQTQGILNLYIQQEKKTKALMYIVLGAAGINVLLNFLLVPKYGAYGAAYATIMSFAILAFIEYQYSKKCYFIPWAWNEILPYFFGLFGILIVFHLFIDLDIYISLIVKASIAFALLYIFSKQYNIINFKDIITKIGGNKT